MNMAANKQCPYRSQEHGCKSDFYVPNRLDCNLCLEGQKADAIELVASAIMEKSIIRLEEEAQKEQVNRYEEIAKKHSLINKHKKG